MMSAAAMGATAFQKGLGAIHSLSHPVGALYDTHHGMTNGVFMPYVLAFNRAGDRAEDRARSPPISALPAASTASCEAVLDLREKTGVPHTLAGLKVDGAKRDAIAEMAIVDPTAGSNPVPLTKEGALEIFDAAMAGELPKPA